MAKKKTIYSPVEWESVIHCDFKKNPCSMEVLEHCDTINYKSTATFPEYKSVISD